MSQNVSNRNDGFLLPAGPIVLCERQRQTSHNIVRNLLILGLMPFLFTEPAIAQVSAETPQRAPVPAATQTTIRQATPKGAEGLVSQPGDTRPRARQSAANSVALGKIGGPRALPSSVVIGLLPLILAFGLVLVLRRKGYLNSPTRPTSIYLRLVVGLSIVLSLLISCIATGDESLAFLLAVATCWTAVALGSILASFLPFDIGIFAYTLAGCLIYFGIGFLPLRQALLSERKRTRTIYIVVQVLLVVLHCVGHIGSAAALLLSGARY